MLIAKRKYYAIIVALYLMAFVISACSRKQSRWDHVIIENKIARDPIYKDLDKQVEVFNGTELWGEKHPDTSMKRTSGVKYTSGNPADFSKDKFATLNNCRAYFYKTDTLLINIGIGSGFAGKGFIIRYKAKKFNIEPYTWTDLIIEGAPEPTYKIVRQNVSLNKSSYTIGDSLYGKVDFKVIENATDGSKVEHIGKGYFRTKIKEY